MKMINFPVIQTNLWDVIFAIPTVILATQLFKVFINVPKYYVPFFALIIGLTISLFFSHPNHLGAAIFMGYLYGYGAIGTYSSFKSSWKAFRNDRRIYSSRI